MGEREIPLVLWKIICYTFDDIPENRGETAVLNTKNNKRKRESVCLLEQAFFARMKETDINHITVAELCRDSGLNRATFYANFLDIYDLADKILNKLEEEVSALYPEPAPIKSGGFLPLFYHIRDNRELYLVYFKLGADRGHVADFYSVEQASFVTEQNLPYHMAFFKNGLNAVIKMWLENGCAESPEEIEGIIEREYLGRLEK